MDLSLLCVKNMLYVNKQGIMWSLWYIITNSESIHLKLWKLTLRWSWWGYFYQPYCVPLTQKTKDYSEPSNGFACEGKYAEQWIAVVIKGNLRCLLRQAHFKSKVRKLNLSSKPYLLKVIMWNKRIVRWLMYFTEIQLFFC